MQSSFRTWYYTYSSLPKLVFYLRKWVFNELLPSGVKLLSSRTARVQDLLLQDRRPLFIASGTHLFMNKIRKTPVFSYTPPNDNSLHCSLYTVTVDGSFWLKSLTGKRHEGLIVCRECWQHESTKGMTSWPVNTKHRNSVQGYQQAGNSRLTGNTTVAGGHFWGQF